MTEELPRSTIQALQAMWLPPCLSYVLLQGPRTLLAADEELYTRKEHMDRKTSRPAIPEPWSSAILAQDP
jgi:hypothetical protein